MFQTALVDEDIQDGFSTVPYVPGHESEDHESWYITWGSPRRLSSTHQLQNYAHQLITWRVLQKQNGEQRCSPFPFDAC
jgi:hypothetical protein